MERVKAAALLNSLSLSLSLLDRRLQLHAVSVPCIGGGRSVRMFCSVSFGTSNCSYGGGGR